MSAVLFRASQPCFLKLRILFFFMLAQFGTAAQGGYLPTSPSPKAYSIEFDGVNSGIDAGFPIKDLGYLTWPTTDSKVYSLTRFFSSSDLFDVSELPILLAPDRIVTKVNTLAARAKKRLDERFENWKAEQFDWDHYQQNTLRKVVEAKQTSEQLIKEKREEQSNADAPQSKKHFSVSYLEGVESQIEFLEITKFVLHTYETVRSDDKVSIVDLGVLIETLDELETQNLPQTVKVELSTLKKFLESEVERSTYALYEQKYGAPEAYRVIEKVEKVEKVAAKKKKSLESSSPAEKVSKVPELKAQSSNAAVAKTRVQYAFQFPEKSLLQTERYTQHHARANEHLMQKWAWAEPIRVVYAEYLLNQNLTLEDLHAVVSLAKSQGIIGQSMDEDPFEVDHKIFSLLRSYQAGEEIAGNSELQEILEQAKNRENIGYEINDQQFKKRLLQTADKIIKATKNPMKKTVLSILTADVDDAVSSLLQLKAEHHSSDESITMVAILRRLGYLLRRAAEFSHLSLYQLNQLNMVLDSVIPSLVSNSFPKEAVEEALSKHQRSIELIQGQKIGRVAIRSQHSLNLLDVNKNIVEQDLKPLSNFLQSQYNHIVELLETTNNPFLQEIMVASSNLYEADSHSLGAVEVDGHDSENEQISQDLVGSWKTLDLAAAEGIRFSLGELASSLTQIESASHGKVSFQSSIADLQSFCSMQGEELLDYLEEFFPEWYIGLMRSLSHQEISITDIEPALKVLHFELPVLWSTLTKEGILPMYEDFLIMNFIETDKKTKFQRLK